METVTIPITLHASLVARLDQQATAKVTKRSCLRREFREALEKRQEMLDSDIYLTPVRLEEGEIPEELREHQGVDLFAEDGWTRLVEALQVGMERRGEGLPAAPGKCEAERFVPKA